MLALVYRHVLKPLELLQNSLDEDGVSLRFRFLRSIDNAVLTHITTDEILPIYAERLKHAESVYLGTRLYEMSALPNTSSVTLCLSTLFLNLCSLDLHTYATDSDALLQEVAMRYPNLKRLYVNREATQGALDLFHFLEVLDVSCCRHITNVHCTASSLLVLSAEEESGISDAGIQYASSLQVLRVWNNPKVTTVAPFALTLKELHCRGSSGIGDAGIAPAVNLEFLNACDNARVTSVAPFAHKLRALDARGSCGIDDAALQHATRLVYLDAWSNQGITTVRPFADSLLVLRAGDVCGIGDAGLAGAVNLVECNSMFNGKITKRTFR